MSDLAVAVDSCSDFLRYGCVDQSDKHGRIEGQVILSGSCSLT